MSVINLNSSNVRLITLGENTTAISQIHVDNSKASSGIAFSNIVNGKATKENAVIIEIRNSAGIYAYIRAIIDLLSTWEVDDNIKLLLNSLSKNLTNSINNNK